MRGKVISVANQKGGVGKTTTAINLSASLAVAEKKILVIDIDPQGNSSSGLSFQNSQPSVYDLLIGDAKLPETIVKDVVPYLDLIPATIDLVGAEVELLEMEDREYILKERIEKARSQYDYIFIDCPPTLGILTLNALTASDSVLIPVQCEYFALEGLGQLLKTIKLVKDRFNKNLSIEGVILTMYDARLKLSEQVAEEVRKYFEDKVFSTKIHRNVRVSEAPSHGKPVLMYDALSMGAKNYLELAQEFLGRNKKK
ncbi:MAG: AAA family ATPase [Ignavibacteriales bacterium]|nr:MAG: ParA family protein [Ignavibacteriaceae bacterium]MBW7872321.1 ParA family protein [Ignavibacteria bacterium]MCZ2142604.1 AAA family ATPase [Ignavibacteriales bacterium]MBV6445532.1 Sporulation initiation inhibitor protein Soj [Ignavibacteriaceae bacterium]MBZ0196927.1 AAA family ATPase [Ignavibacteriaceae bacterium]